MKQKKNVNVLIEEMRLRLNKPKYTFESFMMPGMNDAEEFDGYEGDEEDILVNQGEQSAEGQKEFPEQQNKISGIEKELTQIRKIALGVITRLADQPTSPQYDTMKKIWNLVDKALEEPVKGNQG